MRVSGSQMRGAEENDVPGPTGVTRPVTERWNRWRLIMHDREPGSSTESAERTAAEASIARFRRLLGFGLTRASTRLRTVTKSGEPIRARARLESAQIEERYYHRQEISLNPYSEVSDEPAGHIKLVLPYDGEKYFTREAHRDVVRARHLGADCDADAIIGFLALTGYENTNLAGLLGLEEHHGSIPIQVQLPPTPGPHEVDPLLADRSACMVSHDYRPNPRMTIPLHIDVELDDPDTAEIPLLPESIAERLHITRQVDFKPDLSLSMTVQLNVPREMADGAQAMVSEVFISWPTRTSLRSLDLQVDGQPHRLRYNPERDGGGGLEWRDVPMISEPEPPGGEIRVFRSPRMVLSIPQPGDLYRQENLGGRVEATIDRLLSGMDARLFDATGRVGHGQQPGLESVISADFSLTLDDAFARRTRSPHQQMHFDEVIPSNMRVDDIMTSLRNRGFTVEDPQQGVDPDSWWLTAKRRHGPDTLSMLLYADGKRYRSRRERQVPGGMTYHTTVDSGELRLYVYGRLPGNSTPVVQEMNALRRALRERFDRLPARR
jgi:hypothetical protein